MSGDLEVQTHLTARHPVYLRPEGRGAVRPKQVFCVAPAGTPTLLPTKLVTPFARLVCSHLYGLKLMVPGACATQSHRRKGQTHASLKITTKTD
jgi:hypothetical protein